jgi:asparagine synthase (glutamine-hydrolysing)
MANSLETRSPLLDRELTEYVASLPDDFKIRGAQRKFILRQAFGDLLPDSVQHRRKMGFGVPLDAWFRGELRGFLREHLLAGDARYTSFLARSAVEGLVEAHENGSANLGLQLWTVLTFEVWLRALPAWQRDGALRAEGATA